MKDLYIVSDVHGDYEGLRKALYRAELFDNHGLKDPNAFILQIGDLANCVRDSVEDDLKCLSMVGKEIDMMLVGNHEIPYFDLDNTFSGFFSNEGISEILWELAEAGLFLPSYVYLPESVPEYYQADVLISHAGISQSQLNFGTGTTALEVHNKLLYEWEAKNFGHYLFRDCGRARCGMQAVGGMLWCDFDREFEPTHFPQIVGHTSGHLRMKGNAICIDTQRQNDGVPTVLKLT